MHILIQQVCVLFRKGKATLFGGDYLHNHQPVDLHAAWPGSWRLCSSVVSRIQASSSLSCFFHYILVFFQRIFVFFSLRVLPTPAAPSCAQTSEACLACVGSTVGLCSCSEPVCKRNKTMYVIPPGTCVEQARARTTT